MRETSSTRFPCEALPRRLARSVKTSLTSFQREFYERKLAPLCFAMLCTSPTSFPCKVCSASLRSCETSGASNASRHFFLSEVPSRLSCEFYEWLVRSYFFLSEVRSMKTSYTSFQRRLGGKRVILVSRALATCFATTGAKQGA
jgi:hypothetical protein